MAAAGVSNPVIPVLVQLLFLKSEQSNNEKRKDEISQMKLLPSSADGVISDTHGLFFS